MKSLNGREPFFDRKLLFVCSALRRNRPPLTKAGAPAIAREPAINIMSKVGPDIFEINTEPSPRHSQCLITTAVDKSVIKHRLSFRKLWHGGTDSTFSSKAWRSGACKDKFTTSNPLIQTTRRNTSSVAYDSSGPLCISSIFLC